MKDRFEVDDGNVLGLELEFAFKIDGTDELDEDGSVLEAVVGLVLGLAFLLGFYSFFAYESEVLTYNFLLAALVAALIVDDPLLFLLAFAKKNKLRLLLNINFHIIVYF